MIAFKRVLEISALLSFAGLAHADYINGVAWSVPAGTAAAAPTIGTTPGSGATEIVTFTANGIKFSGDQVYTLGGFLNSGGVAGNIAYMNGASGTTNLNNTEWEFTGSAFFTNGQVFNVQHDDGVNMYVNGAAVLLAEGPTSPVVTPFTYSGATGTFSFDFIYVECCGGAADFATTLVPTAPSSGTPEPSTAFLLVGGLSVGFLAIRRRSAKA